MTNTIKVFVYGSLKAGYNNHSVLGPDAVLLGHAVTTARYRMISVGFPVIRSDGDGHPVRGELYEVPLEQLPRLDALEGQGRMYDRVIRQVTLKNGGPVSTCIYEAHPGRFDRMFLDEGLCINPDDHGELVWENERMLEEDPEEEEKLYTVCVNLTILASSAEEARLIAEAAANRIGVDGPINDVDVDDAECIEDDDFEPEDQSRGDDAGRYDEGQP